MSQLETNFSVISDASESVSQSFTARRSQLEKLNGVKKYLTKLQFLADLPGRLQGYVDEGQHQLAVHTYGKARNTLSAVGNAASFEGLRAEVALIMQRLTQSLSVRLRDDMQLPADQLGIIIWLLLQLGGNEEVLIKEYLTRCRQAIQEELTSLSVLKTIPKAMPEPAQTTQDCEVSSSLAIDPKVAEDTLFAPASFVKHIGLCIVPELLQMHKTWHSLFLESGPADDAEARHDGTHAAMMGRKLGTVSHERKEQMLLESLKELYAALLEICQRRLSQEDVKPEHLLQALGELKSALVPLDVLMPTYVLGPASQIAKKLAEYSIEMQLSILKNRLGGAVKHLANPTDDETLSSQQLPEQLQGAAATAMTCVRDVLHNSAPLVVPLSKLFNLQADRMAKYLIASLHSLLQHVARSMLAWPDSDAQCVLLCAGFCLYMTSSVILQVPAMLTELFAPFGLGGAALSFDTASLLDEMALATDHLFKRFVGEEVHRN